MPHGQGKISHITMSRDVVGSERVTFAILLPWCGLTCCRFEVSQLNRSEPARSPFAHQSFVALGQPRAPE